MAELPSRDLRERRNGKFRRQREGAWRLRNVWMGWRTSLCRPLWEGPDILSIHAYFRLFLMFVAY